MKIRSWQVSLAGIFAQLIFALFFLNIASNAEGAGGFVFFLVSLSVIYGAVLGVIPTLLLYFDRTKMIGAAVAILFGIVGIFTAFTKIVGTFLIASGILFLWRGN
jgi:hypothetical protein